MSVIASSTVSILSKLCGKSHINGTVLSSLGSYDGYFGIYSVKKVNWSLIFPSSTFITLFESFKTIRLLWMVRDISLPMTVGKKKEEIVQFFYNTCVDCVSKIAVMHDLRLIHTDLKPENILFISSEYVKVPDYKVFLLFFWCSNFRIFRLCSIFVC